MRCTDLCAVSSHGFTCMLGNKAWQLPLTLPSNKGWFALLFSHDWWRLKGDVHTAVAICMFLGLERPQFLYVAPRMELIQRKKPPSFDL